MTKLVFPKPEELPILPATTKNGLDIYLIPRKLEWTEKWLREDFTPFCADVDWQHFNQDRSAVVLTSNPDEEEFERAVRKAEKGHMIRNRDQFYKGERIQWDIYDAPNECGNMLASRGVTDINLEEALGVPGWAVVRRQLRGQGIMPAATEAMVKWLEEYGFRTLEAHIGETNFESQRHISKVGFVLTNERPKEGSPAFIWRRELNPAV